MEQKRKTNFASGPHRIIESRDDFFAFVSQFNDDFAFDPEHSYDSLSDYFEAWIAHKKTTFERMQLGNASNKRWSEYAQLLPFVYIAVIDAILVDPTHLDYFQEEKGIKHTVRVPRPMRRVLCVEDEEDVVETVSGLMHDLWSTIHYIG